MKPFDQEKQNAKDLKKGEAVKAQIKREKSEAAEQAKLQDMEIFKYFDIIFYDEILVNPYQIDVSRRPAWPHTFTSLVFDEIYLRLPVP